MHAHYGVGIRAGMASPGDMSGYDVATSALDVHAMAIGNLSRRGRPNSQLCIANHGGGSQSNRPKSKHYHVLLACFQLVASA